MTNKNEMPFKLTKDDVGRHVRQISTGEIDRVRIDPGNGWIHPGVMYEWKGYQYDLEFVDVTPTRAAQPQPPVIEGLQEALNFWNAEAGATNDLGRQHFETIKKAARLYAQGQTVQPVDLDYITHHHDFKAACSLALANAFTEDDKSYWQHQIDTLDRIEASRGMIVTAQQPTEDAQRALARTFAAVRNNVSSSIKQNVLNDLETIRAALAQKVGE